MKSIKYLFLALIATVMVGCTEDTTYEPGPQDSADSAQLYFPDQAASILLMPTDAFESEVTISRAGATPASYYYVQIVSASDVLDFGDTTTVDVDGESVEVITVNFAEGQTDATIPFTFADAEIASSYSASLAIYSEEAAIYKTTGFSFSVMVSYTWTLVTGDNGDTTATWSEGLLGGIFSGINIASKEVALYEAAEVPGYYRIRNIYTTDFVGDLWGGPAEDEEGYALDSSETADYYTYIHAENPDQVWIEYCDTGYFCYYDDYGNFAFASYVPENAATTGYTGSTACYGVLADGVITFPGDSFLVWLTVYGGPWMPDSGLTITMPGTELIADPSEMYSMTYNGCFTDTAGTQYAVIDFEVNETTTSVKYALIESASVDVDAVAAGIVDGSIASTEITEYTGVYVELPGAGLYSVVGVTYGGEYGEAGEVSAYNNVVAFKISGSSDDEEGFVFASGTTTLQGYSYFDSVWYSEDVTIDYDSSTGDVTVYGLFYGFSTVGVTGTYDADAKTISIPDWQLFGAFDFGSYGVLDVYFANANDESDIVFTLNATETAFETTQWWGYYISGAGWYDVYSSSYFNVVTNISAAYTLYGYSYFDGVWYGEDVVLSLDSAEGTASISGLLYGYSSYTATGTYDKSAGTISIPDWQLLGALDFGDSYGVLDVYFANANDESDIVFTLNSVGTAYETSQMWGYYVSGAGWYDAYTTSYLSPSTASAAPAVYAKAADRLDLATVSTVSAPASVKSVVAPTTSLKSTMTIGSQVKAASSKASNLELNSINSTSMSKSSANAKRQIKTDARAL